MSEKQGGTFSGVDTKETFKISEVASPLMTKAEQSEKQIVLNIAETKGSKISLRQTVSTIKFTGNPVVDAFTRVNEFLIDHEKIKIRDKATFFRLLAVMLNAGLSLIKSLNTLADQNEKIPKLKKILLDMARSIEGGRSLSESMSDYPDVFGDSQVGMVKAGEASGQLNVTLKALADELEKNASVTGKVKGALIYPVVVFCLLGVVIFLMMVLVVPQLSSIFASTGKELPLPTRIMIAISNACVNYWPFIVVGIMGIIGFFSFWKKTKSGRAILDNLKLHLPIFGIIFQKSAISKFARSFSNMMGAGVPITKSIEIVANSIGNEVYKKKLLLLAEDMKRGIPMAENMMGNKLFPSMLVNMIEVGEQTAQLDTVVLKVADFYDEEIDEVVKNLTKIMEPLVLVVIGVSVGGLVAAIMLPIMQLTSFAGSM